MGKKKQIQCPFCPPNAHTQRSDRLVSHLMSVHNMTRESATEIRNSFKCVRQPQSQATARTIVDAGYISSGISSKLHEINEKIDRNFKQLSK